MKGGIGMIKKILIKIIDTIVYKKKSKRQREQETRIYTGLWLLKHNLISKNDFANAIIYREDFVSVCGRPLHSIQDCINEGLGK